VNQDEIRGAGVELLAVERLGSATLTGDLTLQDVKGFEADGTEVELEYEPALAGKFGLEGPLLAALRGSAAVRYMSQQLCENPEAGGLQPLDGSASLDLTVRRLFSLGNSRALSRMDASASMRNVTDAAVFDQCGLPQPGRLVQIQFRIW
jgi:iron complex outermembrane receptor protein